MAEDAGTGDSRRVAIHTFERGEFITAQKLNTIVRAIKTIQGGVRPARQISSPLQQCEVWQMKIIENSANDYLSCQAWDGSNQDAQVIKVAKPYLVQGSIWDGFTISGYSFAVTGVDAMTVTRISDSSTEDWLVTMDYVVGDIIYAVTSVRGGVDCATKVDYIDLNIDGRGWAKV